MLWCDATFHPQVGFDGTEANQDCLSDCEQQLSGLWRHVTHGKSITYLDITLYVTTTASMRNCKVPVAVACRVRRVLHSMGQSAADSTWKNHGKGLPSALAGAASVAVVA